MSKSVADWDRVARFLSFSLSFLAMLGTPEPVRGGKGRPELSHDLSSMCHIHTLFIEHRITILVTYKQNP